MNILGLNLFHADTSACLVKDGKLISAVEEERFSRIKHFTGFPLESIKFCLKESNLKIADIDFIAVNNNKMYNYREKLSFGLKNLYRKNILLRAHTLFTRPNINDLFLKNLEYDVIDKIKYIPHHLSHIASTYLQSECNEALGFSFDGSGDFSTTEIYDLYNNDLKLIEKILYPHSLGIFYQAFTQFLGFKNYGDEYKVMGLAAYGEPIYKERIQKVLNDDNFFNLDLKYFDHHERSINYNFDSGSPYFDDLFSKKLEYVIGKSRKRNEPVTKFHMDVASSVQFVLENTVIKKLNELQKKKNYENLCLSGGCAFNSVLNGKIVDQTKFKNVFTSPNVGDAGGAVGAALIVAMENKENIVKKSSMFLGTEYTNDYIKENIVEKNLSNETVEVSFYEDFEELTKIVAKHLSEKKIIGWFQGKMEWGPRALGNRSILADPTNPNVRDLINIKIKKREDFRPFAPSVLHEKAEDYFHIKKESSFMSSVFVAKDNVKKLVPSVVHVDGSARVQTVSKEDNHKYHQLIQSFEKNSGIPILLNTSLNVNEPICENPENAYEIFTQTLMDVLVLEQWVFIKKHA